MRNAITIRPTLPKQGSGSPMRGSYQCSSRSGPGHATIGVRMVAVVGGVFYGGLRGGVGDVVNLTPYLVWWQGHIEGICTTTWTQHETVCIT